jgi:REP element-mobilizing transposase RayT
MPRRLVIFEPGGYFHLYNRGVNRQEIFFAQMNYHYFLMKVEQYLMPIVDIIAYCLMPNHYHLLICVKDTSEVFKTSEVSRAMMRLSVSYTKTINLLYDRVGPLFQGAFQAKMVDSEDYLWQLIGYIHLNPVESRLVDDPGDWRYSSYLLIKDLRGLNDLGGLHPLPRL